MKINLISAAVFGLLSSWGYAENKLVAPETKKINTPSMSLTLPNRPVEDCNYPIPASVTLVDPAIITQWAKKAALQVFDFNDAQLTNQLEKLKSCFTNQGWIGFSEALEKSGNITAIKTQHLRVSGEIEGQVTLNEAGSNQWKVSIPMQVVYQNSKERLSQTLTVDLLIGRKVSGNLGIMQVVAVTKEQSKPIVKQ